MPVSPIPAAPAVKPRATSKTAPAPKVNVKSKTEQRAEGLLGIAQIGHGVLLMMGQYADAGAVRHFVPPICRETANLAESHEGIGAGIDYLSAVGPYTALMAACIPFTLQLLANHRKVDATKLAGSGVMSPEVLESREKAEILKQQTEALRQQREAEEEYRRAQADLEDIAN